MLTTEGIVVYSGFELVVELRAPVKYWVKCVIQNVHNAMPSPYVCSHNFHFVDVNLELKMISQKETHLSQNVVES